MKIDYSDVEQLIYLSRKVHGDKYIYSLLTPTSNREKSCIICSEHGPFYQRIYMHIYRKQGCPKCEGLNMTNDEFINKSLEVHKSRYTYPRTIFNGKRKNVLITCKEHGDFKQISLLHLMGAGCPYCAGCARSDNSDFIKKSNIVHNNIYDYRNINYTNARTPVEIICRKHGSFYQTPNKHLMGHGCPKCSCSKGELQIEKLLKINKINYIPQKVFKDCFYKRNLKFDFYLLDYDICIEYDGEQHSTNYRFEKDMEGLKVRKIRDQIKNIYCDEKGIKFYRINFNDNIEQKLNNIISDNKI